MGFKGTIMKKDTNIRNKTVLIKSLKKITKHKYYSDDWSDANYMDYLCGTIVELDHKNCIKNTNIKAHTTYWTIHPWMVQAIVECPKEEDVIFDEEKGLYDKQPVWAWDNDDTCMRELKFYDAINKCCFTFKGTRGGISVDNYEAVTQETLDANPWIREMRKLLKEN